jgi:predicted N-acetyltransferase YhbS
MNDTLKLLTIIIRPENSADDDTIEALAEAAFGPGRFARAAFRLREGVEAEDSLSFVATDGEKIIGSVRQTKILIGGKVALVLGPLITDPSLRNLGIGRELMNRALLEAQREGYEYVLLVGDEPYYGKFGFERVKPGSITLPGPADPMRILGCELVPGAAARYSGPATRFNEEAIGKAPPAA